MTATSSEFITLGKWFTKDNFVGIAEVQKSPKKSLQGFRRIMNGPKPQGVYMDYETRENFIEDFEMVSSPWYQQKITESRKGKIIPAEQVWEELGLK